MSTLTKTTLGFLSDLKKNNNRDWFNDNKKRFTDAKEEFEDFVGSVMVEIKKFDNTIAHHSAKDCIFRIYRDVRFSKDKSPYKTHFGAHITAAAKRSEIHSKAGYYIHIGAGESVLAGGAYLPQGDWLKAIRQEIVYNTDEFKKILNNADFKKYFRTMEGEQLKTAPRDYPKDHPEIALLKYKSFLGTHPLSDHDVLRSDLANHAGKVFKALYPFDQFLNESIK